VFYAWGGPVYLALLALMVVPHYLAGLAIARIPAQGRAGRRLAAALLALILILDLGILLLNRVGVSIPLAHPWAGARFVRRAGHLGVSFLVLALMSYVIDVHRRQVASAHDPIRFTAWLALFPKIVAGPIVRWRDLGPQLARPRISRAGFASGVRRFVTGLAKKVLIADTLATPVNEIFSAPPSSVTAGAAWLGAIGFALQLVYDFSGYSDMAIGIARMCGLEFAENFDHPYVSRSIREFWRRWHISLSQWLRDYVHLPLAYSVSRWIVADRVLNIRAETWAYASATLVTMLLCGLWHGITWGCVIWGLWLALALIVEASRSGKWMLRRLGSPGRLVLTQWIVLMGWVVFRAPSLSRALELLRAMYGLPAGVAAEGERISLATLLDRPLALALVCGVIGCAPLGSILRRAGARVEAGAGAGSWIPAGLAFGEVGLLLALLLLTLVTMAGGTYTPFVYQQF